jgi:hypothetical protein
MLKKAKDQINEKFAGKEIHIIKAVNLLEDLNSVNNLLKENATEWKMRQPTGEAEESYLELEKNNKTIEEEKQKLTLFIEKEMNEEFPNFSVLATPIIGAKLLASAGSKKRLCMMPASTIQLLGAEKALFAHIRKNAKSPKHGHLFNHPLMQKLPRVKRGRAARMIAGKLTIALKQDYFGGENTSSEVQKEMQKRIDSLIAEPITAKQEQKELEYDAINNERRQLQFDKENKKKEWRATPEETEEKPIAEHKTFSPEERKAYFQKRGMGKAYKTRGPPRDWIQKAPYRGSSEGNSSYGGSSTDRPRYNSPRPSYGGSGADRSSYGKPSYSRPSYGGRPSYGNTNSEYSGEKTGYETKRAIHGTNQAVNRDKPRFGKPNYGPEREEGYSDRGYRTRDSETSFGQDRTRGRSFGKGRFNKPSHSSGASKPSHGFKKRF